MPYSLHFYSHASCEAWLSFQVCMLLSLYFYSHASCEAWRQTFQVWHECHTFLLTRLMRGVTSWIREDKSPVDNFYSHASCEAWLQCSQTRRFGTKISTHTPHARRDLIYLWTRLQSQISTHTPHARRDWTLLRAWERRCDFYSHASCEAWHLILDQLTALQNFYSHASCEAWRWTVH